MLCSKLDNWFVRLPSGEGVHSSKSHHHITNPGLLQRVDILVVTEGYQNGGGVGWRER